MKALWKIVKYSGELWRLYVGIAIFTVIVAALGLVRPILVGRVIDTITTSLQGREAIAVAPLMVFGGIIFVADLLNNLLGNWGGYIGDLMAIRLKRLLSERYYEKLMRLPQGYFDNELTGTVVNRLTRTIDNITRFMQMMSNNFISIFLTIFMVVIYIALYSWPVALLVVILVPLYFLLTRKTSARWQVLEGRINELMDEASGRFTESVTQIKVVKSFIQEVREPKFFKTRFNKAHGITKQQSQLWHRQDIQRKLLLNVIFLAIYGFLIWQVAHGSITPGHFTTIVLMVNTVTFPIASMGFIVENAQRAIAGSRDYFKVMDLHPAITDIADAEDLKAKQGGIIFDSVHFAYDHVPVLKDINFAIEPNSKVALVGESGEGKTTITNLLLRLYEPQEGTITIDGQNINHVSQKSLRENIGAVFQDPSLFSGTIMENIAYAKPKASKKAVVAAAKVANAHEFIEKLEKGYDSPIGERGVKLSGGQKQRIAIARAILKDAPILILDEATSSLDSKSEHLVQQALERLMRGRTTLIIAHRLSTIQNVDKIITLQKGRVDEAGTPAELARSGGIYAQLLKLQSGEPEDAKQSLKKYEIV